MTETLIAPPRPLAVAHGPLVMVCDADLELSDGRRTHVTEVARWLAAHGFAVELVSRGPDPSLPGVRYHGGPAGGRRLRQLLGLNARAIALLARRRRRPRRLYLREDTGSLPVMLAARALGYRVVLEVNELAFGPGRRHDASGLRSRLVDLVKVPAARLSLGRAHALVVVSDGLRDQIVEHYGVPAERITVIPNGVDTELFHPREDAADTADLDPALRYLVFVGFFDGSVDFATMTRAFARAAAAHDDARLLVIGDGPRRPELERLVAELGLGERVTLVGPVADRRRVRALLAASHIGLAPLVAVQARNAIRSPLKIGEYLACGLPVIATAYPGGRGTVERTGGGIAVPAEDVDAMADAMLLLLDDPDRRERLGRLGRQEVVARYSWRSVAERTVPLLEPEGAARAPR